MDKLVSIIIPCYNSALYIEETVESVKNQTYPNIEVIIINDGSTDNTSEILKIIRDKNQDFQIIEQENQGLSSTRQTGFSYSRGEYLLFLDSDDKIHSTYVEKAVAVLDGNPQVGIVTCRAMLFEKYNMEWILKPFVIHDFLLENSIFATSFVRRDDYIKIGGFDNQLTHFEDWDFFISIIKLGRKVYKIPEILFYYRKRMNESSMSDEGERNKNILSDNILKIYTKHYEFYKQNNLDIKTLMDCKATYETRRLKHYNVWYRKYFYKIFKPKKYKEIFS